MGLDEFLIPQDPSALGVLWPLDDIDEVLAAPPIGPDAPVDAGGSPPPGQPGEASTRPPDQNDRPKVSMLNLAPDTASSRRVDSTVLAPPPISERVETRGPARATRSRSDGPKARSERPFSAFSEIAEKLGGVLATTESTLATPPIEDFARIESEFMPMSPLISSGRSADFAATTTTPGRGLGSTFASAHRAQQSPQSRDDLLTPTDPAENPDGTTNEPQFANDYERIEGRLSQVAERLERALERITAPPPPIGSRPRPFRGRVDG